MVVVRFDDEGRFVDFHHLQGEEAFVEWQGGVLDLNNDDSLFQPTLNDDLCQDLQAF